MNWHSLSIAEAFKKTGSNEKGLTSLQARQRLKRFGFNELKETRGESVLHLFFSQFADFLNLLMLGAAGVAFLLGETLDATAIAAVVLLNVVIGFAQEYKAEKAIQALKQLTAPKALVVRDGEETVVEAESLVPGDVILLNEGDRVPADCRLLQCIELRADEASLTGESVPVKKDVKALPEKTLLGDRSDVAFFGTTIAHGRGKGLVVATGMNTEMGRVAELVQATESDKTPLQKQLAQLGKQLGVVAVAACVIIFVLGILSGNDLLEMFLTSVSLAVAAIPSGLPAVVTITLAVGVHRMASRSAIIRKRSAVETLGAATVICTDKTGTLTKNEMTVREVFVDGQTITVTGSGYETKGDFLLKGGKSGASDNPSLKALLEGAVLCNNAGLKYEVGRTSIIGDPTEASLLVMGGKAGLNYKKKQGENEFVSEVPFSSERKTMTVVRRRGREFTAFSKGAPEMLLEKCSCVLVKGKEKRLTPREKKRLLEQNKRMASRALRVLGFAFKRFKEKPGARDVEGDLVFVGLAGMNDPPRPEAIEAIAACRKAGVNVTMITGDNPLTAVAVGKEMGLFDGGRVVTGAELDELSDERLAATARHVKIFARISPEHKLRIVNAFKAHGEVVAVTGDGVNDAPAVKRADIGVSMGITGTEVTKEASDMVVVDDNFASIVAAIEEGRTVYSNIVKSVTYLVSCNIGEVLTIFFAVLGGLKTPLLPIQILWMNLVTDGAPALALAVEPAEKDVMVKPPRERGRPILGRHNALDLLAVGAWMCLVTLALYSLFLPHGLEKARTIAFSTIIMLQMFFALDSRSEHSLFRTGWLKNKWLWLAVLLGFGVQVLIVNGGWLDAVFHVVPLAAWEWAAVFFAGSTVLIIRQGIKLWRELK